MNPVDVKGLEPVLVSPKYASSLESIVRASYCYCQLLLSIQTSN